MMIQQTFQSIYLYALQFLTNIRVLVSNTRAFDNFSENEKQWSTNRYGIEKDTGAIHILKLKKLSISWKFHICGNYK